MLNQIQKRKKQIYNSKKNKRVLIIYRKNNKFMRIVYTHMCTHIYDSIYTYVFFEKLISTKV